MGRTFIYQLNTSLNQLKLSLKTIHPSHGPSEKHSKYVETGSIVLNILPKHNIALYKVYITQRNAEMEPYCGKKPSSCQTVGKEGKNTLPRIS